MLLLLHAAAAVPDDLSQRAKSALHLQTQLTKKCGKFKYVLLLTN
jgi:hypothetical protein